MEAGARSGPQDNLPVAVTSFVGRRRELDACRRRMAESRLVTLVGAGGVGKTRLALETASQSRRAFEDGVFVVDLASLSDPRRVARTMLGALEIRNQSARPAVDLLADHLGDRHVLVVLDNCEHLLDACARLVADLLAAASRLHVLATSREALGIDGEHLLHVPPLDVPDPDGVTRPEDLAGCESVTLLVDRAAGVRPGFALTAENAASVARLCASLDGMPLAIELAATRLRSLSVAQVVERLDDRFRLLTGGNRAALPRQQTLQALIDWSHDLCTPQERLLWARLSVFTGAFDLASAERVCGGDGLREQTIVDLLDHLVAKSIVVAEPAIAGHRYRMLVTVRQYGSERLDELGEEDVCRRRHRDHFLARAREMIATWSGPGQARWLARLRADHADLRAALAWSLARADEVRAGAALAAALRWHWVVGGFLAEGRRWLEQALAAIDGDAPERAEALWVVAWISLVQGDHEAGAEHLAEAEALAREGGDVALGAHVAQWTGIRDLFGGNAKASVPHFERAVAGHGVTGDVAGGLFALFQLAVARAYAGDLVRARRTCEEGLARSDEHGERWARAYLWWATAIVAWRGGAHEDGEAAGREALGFECEFEDGICSALTIETMAWCATARSDHALAARRLGAADAIWRAIGTDVGAFGPMGEESAASRAATRSALGPARFDHLRSEAAGLGVGEAILFARDGEPPGSEGPSTEEFPLSPRETEVAGLITEGLGNKAIAERLVVSVRTVDGHVERILAKLGFSSRTQVAAWMAEHAPRPSLNG